MIDYKQLDRIGYCVLPKFTNPDIWNDAFACPKIHHGNIAEHIGGCISQLNAMTGWDATVSKFRASAACETTASNATDAVLCTVIS